MSVSVTEIHPGRLVRVEPGNLNERGILEFAAALIEEQGWIAGDSGNATGGWSIHGAIGEAAARVTQAPGGKGDTQPRDFRDQAKRLMEAAYPGLSEFEINDTAKDKDAAVARIRFAMEGKVATAEEIIAIRDDYAAAQNQKQKSQAQTNPTQTNPKEKT